MSGWLRVTKLNAPPGLKSISQTTSGSPAASHQRVTCSVFVQASKISARGASKSRVCLIVLEARSIPRLDPGAFCDTDCMSLLLSFHFRKVRLEIVEPTFPLLAERFDPVGDLFHRQRRQPARSSLRVAPADDQPGLFEHLKMLRNGRLAE